MAFALFTEQTGKPIQKADFEPSDSVPTAFGDRSQGVEIGIRQTDPEPNHNSAIHGMKIQASAIERVQVKNPVPFQEWSDAPRCRNRGRGHPTGRSLSPLRPTLLWCRSRSAKSWPVWKGRHQRQPGPSLPQGTHSPRPTGAPLGSAVVITVKQTASAEAAKEKGSRAVRVFMA